MARGYPIRPPELVARDNGRSGTLASAVATDRSLVGSGDPAISGRDQPRPRDSGEMAPWSTADRYCADLEMKDFVFPDPPEQGSCGENASADEFERWWDGLNIADLCLSGPRVGGREGDQARGARGQPGPSRSTTQDIWRKDLPDAVATLAWKRGLPGGFQPRTDMAGNSNGVVRVGKETHTVSVPNEVPDKRPPSLASRPSATPDVSQQSSASDSACAHPPSSASSGHDVGSASYSTEDDSPPCCCEGPGSDCCQSGCAVCTDGCDRREIDGTLVHSRHHGPYTDGDCRACGKNTWCILGLCWHPCCAHAVKKRLGPIVVD